MREKDRIWTGQVDGGSKGYQLYIYQRAKPVFYNSTGKYYPKLGVLALDIHLHSNEGLDFRKKSVTRTALKSLFGRRKSLFIMDSIKAHGEGYLNTLEYYTVVDSRPTEEQMEAAWNIMCEAPTIKEEEE